MAAWILVHSPFVGPLTWQPTARELVGRGHIVITPTLDVAESRPPYWSHFAHRVADAVRGLPEREPLVLVAHSAAGLLVPASWAAMAGRTVCACVFVDATLPRDGASLVELIPVGVGITMDRLREQAEGGLLPPWGTGWPDETGGSSYPTAPSGNASSRNYAPRPSRSTRNGRLWWLAGWPDAACRYLRFSALYADAEEQARRARWPTREVRGGHLHMLVEPAAVAEALIELAS
jgi:hypothetical protein